MAPIDDATLLRMLGDLESDRVERMSSLKGDAPTKIREAVCAFANDLPGHRAPGVVFVGANDDGSPSAAPITDELLTALADIKTDGNTLPPPSLTVEKRTLAGSPMAVVTVQPSDSPPVKFKGKVWVRTGPRRDIATAQDERILNERRRHFDSPYDVHPVRSASIADLDLVRFERDYLPAVVAADVLAANERTLEQKLASTKMIATVDDPVPTVVGLIVVGRDPRRWLSGHYVQFLRVQGTTLGDPVVDELLIDGALTELVRRLDDKLLSHNREAVRYRVGPVEHRTALYPVPALQQLTRNALLHRTFESTNAPVRVYWFDDRLEISSPGGPFGQVTIDNFGQPHLADYRNPNLAEGMRALGLVQKFGSGIAIARAALRDNGNPPPQFDVSASQVLVTLRPGP